MATAADSALEDALEAYSVPAAGRDLLLAEIDRQRRRIQMSPDDGSDLRHDWRDATDDHRDISVLAIVVRELWDSLAA